ncbi:MAG: response regulator [Cyclobacteriaceae bacterium]|nr:response regulator [Cyclobacteriaceae bacterium SS2]
MNKNIEVLLVEDSAEDAELTIDSLREGGLVNEIKWVKDGQEALDTLFGKEEDSIEKPMVILLDLKLPKISGFEVLEKIRSNEAFKDTPVIILSSSKEYIDINRAYDLGVNSYIVKPVNFENFTESIKQIGVYWVALNRHS